MTKKQMQKRKASNSKLSKFPQAEKSDNSGQFSRRSNVDLDDFSYRQQKRVQLNSTNKLQNFEIEESKLAGDVKIYRQQNSKSNLDKNKHNSIDNKIP